MTKNVIEPGFPSNLDSINIGRPRNYYDSPYIAPIWTHIAEYMQVIVSYDTRARSSVPNDFELKES